MEICNIDEKFLRPMPENSLLGLSWLCSQYFKHVGRNTETSGYNCLEEALFCYSFYKLMMGYKMRAEKEAGAIFDGNYTVLRNGAHNHIFIHRTFKTVAYDVESKILLENEKSKTLLAYKEAEKKIEMLSIA